MPWSPFGHVPRKTGREGTPEIESTDIARKKKRPSYLQEFDIIAKGLDDKSSPVKKIEPEKEKKATMPSIQEKQPEAKVKEKSSYKKLISNLQTTYPDLSQEEALKGILALRVQNNGTLTGMTMLEIMERVIQFARPEKQEEEREPQEVKKDKVEEILENKSESKKETSKQKNTEVKSSTNGDDTSPSKNSQVDIERLDIKKQTPKTPKTMKTYGKKGKKNLESEDESVPEPEETPSKKGKKKNEESKEEDKSVDSPAADKEETPTPKKRENLINKKAREQKEKKMEREPSLESVDDLLLSEKGEDSDASFQPEPPKKSPARKMKPSPKKKKEKEESESEINAAEDNEETPKKTGNKRKETVETPRTASKSRGRKKATEDKVEDEKDEESDVSFKPDPPQKTPKSKKKTSPKKKQETTKEADTDEEVEMPRTASKPRGRKKVVEEIVEEEKAEESDASFNPDPPPKTPKLKKKSSPKKKEEKPQEEDSDEEVEIKEAKKSQQKSKKGGKNNEMVESMLEELDEQPRTSRKRKVPSYLREFTVEESKPVEEADVSEDKPDPETPKPRSAKRRKIEEDPEPETPKRKKADVEPKTPKRKKERLEPATPKSSHKKKAAPSTSTSEHGECVLCGLMFDEESTKFGMSDKTRETGQTFADILFGLFHEESLPPSLAEKAKAVDLDSGSLCTLCVSHVDQLDVFQQKVTDIKTSIISIFIQKTRNDSLNQGEVESGESDSEEETNVVVKVTPKKKGKKGKGKTGKLVTLVYQSPLKKVKDLEAMSEKEISKMTEMVIKYTPKKSKKLNSEENENEEESMETNEEKNDSKPDADLAQKLSALSGIEIKRINNETGDESLQISGLAGIEIKKISDSSEEKKTPSKKKSPKKEKTPRKTPAKKKTPKKGKNASIEVAGEPVFEEACEALQNDLGEVVENSIEPIAENITEPPVETVEEPPVASRPTMPARGGGVRGRGGMRGAPRGGVARGMIRPNMNFGPAPPRSKKSLFELSQNKRKIGTLVTSNGISLSPHTPAPHTPVLENYRMNGIQATSTPFIGSTVQTLHVPVTPLPVFTPIPLTPNKLNGLTGISITPSVTMSPMKDSDIQAPAEVKEKKAYKKLIAKIQAVHPDMSHDEAMRGIVALRTANNGTLTGMSMTEIITRVRDNVRGNGETIPMETETEVTNSIPAGLEFEKIVNSPPPPPPQSQIFMTPTKTVDPSTLYEIKCKFCSRLFKSSSETATKKVYEIHIQEHEKETRNIFEKETPETELTVAADEPATEQSPATEQHEEPDPVKSEKSYCKPCQKQFKSGKQYGLHQNTEHAAEIEFEKIMTSP